LKKAKTSKKENPATVIVSVIQNILTAEKVAIPFEVNVF